jgi:hypothetical protein
MRTTSQSRLTVLAAVLAAMPAMLAVMAAGCTFVPVKPEPKATLGPALDPCASRLHDVAGSLLLYYATHNAIPPDLAGVKQASGEACPPLQCPLSGEPYVYNPMGIEIHGLPGLVVLHDATACHDGNKWGLVASQMGPGKPLQVQVLLLPAGAFPAPPAPGEPGVK